ncbi:unnamed protein product [Ilex paraguariensis]|uniref:Uncharacterized protein n=1 Tax=Ilex paraguariensis TaxID=185542 RepID=A0ABC8RU99_9AQUA
MSLEEIHETLQANNVYSKDDCYMELCLEACIDKGYSSDGTSDWPSQEKLKVFMSKSKHLFAKLNYAEQIKKKQEAELERQSQQLNEALMERNFKRITRSQAKGILKCLGLIDVDNVGYKAIQ